MPAKLKIALVLILAASAALAAPKMHRAPRPMMFHMEHPTNETEVLGVKMPPKLTEAQWQEREKIIEDFRRDLEHFDLVADDLWQASLNDKQKKALRDLSATNELNMAIAAAKRAQADAERAWFTNRLAYVTKTVTVGPRRIERFYADGCVFNGSQAVKSTVTSAERGRIQVEILYTADGKKYKIEPIATKKEEK